jgi:hypothetical protein
VIYQTNLLASHAAGRWQRPPVTKRAPTYSFASLPEK